MGIWATLTGGRALDTARPGAPAPMSRNRFAVGEDFQTWTALVGGTQYAGKVARADAARVPAVKRARDLIAGVIGTLPLHAVNAADQPVTHALLDQPEAATGYTRSVSVARTVEDLLYDGAALWLVVLRTSQGFPQAVQRIVSGTWSQDQSTGAISVNGRVVDAQDCILFTSPCDPLLVAGAPAIRNLIRLEATAALYADTPEPQSYFAPAADAIDPADDDDIERLLADWRDARRARATAYVPAAVTLNAVPRLSPEDLQLISAREFAVTEVARLTGIDADWLSVSTTSRTYANSQDARRAYVDYTLAPYLHAIEERLSLQDTTPRGHRVRFNLDGFLRASTTERYAAHATALSAGFLTVDEVRALEDRAPLADAAPPLPEDVSNDDA